MDTWQFTCYICNRSNCRKWERYKKRTHTLPERCCLCTCKSGMIPMNADNAHMFTCEACYHRFCGLNDYQAKIDFYYRKTGDQGN